MDSGSAPHTPDDTGLEQLELPVLRLATRQLRLLVPDQLALDVGEEWRGAELAQAAAPMPLQRAAEHEAIFRPRHADVEQPAFLGERGVVAFAEGERQEPVLEADYEHHAKLK